MSCCPTPFSHEGNLPAEPLYQSQQDVIIRRPSRTRLEGVPGVMGDGDVRCWCDRSAHRAAHTDHAHAVHEHRGCVHPAASHGAPSCLCHLLSLILLVLGRSLQQFPSCQHGYPGLHSHYFGMPLLISARQYRPLLQKNTREIALVEGASPVLLDFGLASEQPPPPV